MQMDWGCLCSFYSNKSRGSEQAACPCMVPASCQPAPMHPLHCMAQLSVAPQPCTCSREGPADPGSFTGASPRCDDRGHAAHLQGSLHFLFSHALCAKPFPCYVCYFTSTLFSFFFFWSACKSLCFAFPPSTGACCLLQPPTATLTWSRSAARKLAFLRK